MNLRTDHFDSRQDFLHQPLSSKLPLQDNTGKLKLQWWGARCQLAIRMLVRLARSKIGLCTAKVSSMVIIILRWILSPVWSIFDMMYGPWLQSCPTRLVAIVLRVVLLCTNRGTRDCRYEEWCLLGYNAVWSNEIQPTFRMRDRHHLHYRKESRACNQHEAGSKKVLILDPENGANILLRNIF